MFIKRGPPFFKTGTPSYNEGTSAYKMESADIKRAPMFENNEVIKKVLRAVKAH